MPTLSMQKEMFKLVIKEKIDNTDWCKECRSPDGKEIEQEVEDIVVIEIDR